MLKRPWLFATLIPLVLVLAVCGERSRAQDAEFLPENFDSPTVIDNEWWPLTPGMQFVYEGTSIEDDETFDHRIVFTVTDLTKVIGGVNSVVIFDRDFSDDELVETELAFFAQDNEGNVWHLGQYSETWEDGELVGGQAWLVGHLDGARAGIMMPTDPQLGTPDYSQGYAPAPFYWTDRARVYEMGQSTTVPYGTFEDVAVMEEYNEEEPGAFQLKYYARGLGQVRVGWRGDDTQQETLELVEVIQLDAEALADERAEALKLEERAYVYGQTPPAEPRGAMGS